MLRFGALLIGLAAAFPVAAQEMNATEARKFVAGKLFTYTCFEGTRGTGRINHDGSVAGTIQFQGSGPVRYAVLPANTLRAKGEQFCASIKGLPFEPCFHLVKTSNESFRGAISGMSFASCEFKRRGGRAEFANAVTKPFQAAAADHKAGQ
jgi:hypothetical protein